MRCKCSLQLAPERTEKLVEIQDYSHVRNLLVPHRPVFGVVGGSFVVSGLRSVDFPITLIVVVRCWSLFLC